MAEISHPTVKSDPYQMDDFLEVPISLLIAR